MIRDPFDIHRKNVFKATAFQAVENLRTTAAHVGATALDMSFNIPKNVPNFGAQHRDLEDKAWSRLSRNRGGDGGFMNGVQSKVSHYFEDDSLPMYKDKPYGYGRRRWWRRKRVMSTIALGLLTFLWLTGFIGGKDKKLSSTSKATWTWLGMSKSNKVADWDERRQSVVEAFELSWDTYSRYAWGRFCSIPCIGGLLSISCQLLIAIL